MTPELVYADDTMLLASSAEAAQRHLACVEQVGKAYGLELNLAKTLFLTIRGEEPILGSDGAPLQQKMEAVYLGGLLSTDGRPVAEVTRRLGEARRTFHNLQAVWRHANIAKRQKQHIFDACVVSKLLYGLESVWLLQADRTKIDAFYASCLRKIAKIPSSFISRVSNATVLAKFSARPLSLQLLVRQLDYFGKLCAQSDDELTRCSALEPQATRPITWGMRKSVGRPRLRWTQCVHAQALLTVDGDASLMQTLVSSPGQRSWKKHLRSFLHDAVDAPS